MVPLATLLTALDDRTLARRQRLSLRLTKGGGFIFFVAFGLAVTTINGYYIWSTLLSVESTRTSHVLFSSVLAWMAWLVEVVAVIVLLVPTTLLARQRTIAQTLRALIGRGDDTLTPPAALQPKPLEPGELDAPAVILRPLRHMGDPAMAAAVFVGTVFLFITVAFTAGIFGPAFAGLRSQAGAANGSLWLVLLAMAAFGPFYLLAIFAVLLRRAPSLGASVTVDAAGLANRRGRRHRVIPWGSVRALAQFTLSPSDLMGARGVPAIAGSTTYLLDAGADDFVWSVRHRAGNAAFLASEALLRQITSRTGLPLRDASALAREVADQSARNAGRLWAQRTPIAGGAPLTLAVMEALKPVAPAPRPSRRAITTGIVLAVALALLNALPPLALVRAAPAWAAYTAGLPDALHAATPLYTTDFARDDGAWPVAQDQGDVGRSYAFSGGAYHLSGAVAGHFILATTPQRLGDGAVEVTVTQQEQTPAIAHPGETGGAAVVFHADAQGVRFIVFDITPEGGYLLDEHHAADARGSEWSVLARGANAAIVTGLGATNIILYLQRGRHITVYVNATLVVDDEFAPPTWLGLPLSGAPGVYSDQSALDTAFTHFTVWPLPPLPDLWATLRG